MRELLRTDKLLCNSMQCDRKVACSNHVSATAQRRFKGETPDVIDGLEGVFCDGNTLGGSQGAVHKDCSGRIEHD